MELTSLQLKTVEQILDLYNPEHKVICEFKAPTGSGKTLMASYFISALIEKNSADRFIFVVATLSSSSLPYFFEQKLNKYKVDLPYSKFEVEYIQSPSSAQNDKSEAIQKIIPEQNKVYIFGKASFGRGRILSEYGIIKDFVISAVEQGYKLIYIRDEAHIGGERQNRDESFESLMAENAAFVLKMTATPNMQDFTTEKVILKESWLTNPLLNEDKWLLKTNPVSLLNRDMQDTEILEDAANKFEEIKNEYAGLNLGIRPAMLIQVKSDAARIERAQIFQEELANVKNTLHRHNLSWVQYFDSNDRDSDRVYKKDFSLNDVSKNDSDVDAVIFKIGPAVGWDIPRACMLVRLANICSEQLNIQTIGRIRRNPYPDLKFNEITDKYYLYSNTPANNNDDVKEYCYQVRDKFASETFLSIDIVNKKEITDSNSAAEFMKKFKNWLSERKNILLQEIGDTFIDGGRTYKKILSSANGRTIYTTVTNPFIFLRDYKRFVNANKPLYDLLENPVTEFCNENKIQKEFAITVLLSRHKKDILDIMAKTRSKKPKYKISEQPYNPQSYREIYGREQNAEKVSKRDYLFGINENDTSNGNRQPLDSEPERTAFNIIYDYAEEDDNVKLWAKNLTTSNIFGEYLDDMFNVKKSYFDFIIKFKNGFYLYIEVKGIPDINADKTALLKKAYGEYFENRAGDLFSPKLAIAVWEANKEKNQIYSSVYYDKKAVPEDLNKLTATELLRTLAGLTFEK